ncbi:MAG: asparagine synthase-related protein [Candidatus Jordarchaeum sp.]|uniref:asparagine synthase-related protein n=1 Tax=Candidatus Jordarchaeum sp. TaxID=2823881 RepID=UPI00404A1106
MTSEALDIKDTCLKIRSLLEESVKRNLAEGILLSGGLDTSIIAALASKYQKLKAFTVAFAEAPSPDVEYAKQITKMFKLEHTIHKLTMKELKTALRTTIRVLKSFDPMEIRNSVVILVDLKEAKKAGVKTVLTGDGADELFAGYSFLLNYSPEELNRELQKIWENVHFSSQDLAAYLKMKVKLPFLDDEFQSFAKQVEPELKVQRENGSLYGKWILRKAFEGILPPNIVWRVKTPIEQGSGTAFLPQIFDELIKDTDFEEKSRNYLLEDGVEIRDKEHLTYYEIYRSKIGVPSPKDSEGKICPKCNSNVKKGSTYCRTCGAYPI